MAMLTHPGGSLEQASHPAGKQDRIKAGAADARLAKIRQFCMCAFTVVLAMGAVAGIIALKAAVYLSRLNFHH